MKIKNKNTIILIIIGVVIIVISLFFLFNLKPQFSSQTVEKKEDKTTIANPASVNCEEKGGKVIIEKMPSRGEYGVCVFEDNRQCEEWALFRSECPTGGMKVTGYTTDAQKYCAITGGTYTPDKKNQSEEQGTCKFFDGTVCDVQDYYEGICSRKAETQEGLNPTPIKATFNCTDKKTIVSVFSGGKVFLTLSDGRQLELNQALSASGARYANSDETFVFWNKGNTAFIEEKGKTTYVDCLQK